MTKDQKLEYVFNAIKKAYPRRKLVFKEGSPDSSVMLIGEAPGKDEEIQSKPFVGRGGKLLMKTLENLGWQRSDFYISNIIKYRPQDDRGGTLTPTEEEIEKFKPAIEKEIDIVDPKLIVVLGRIAMKGTGITGGITFQHGHVFKRNHRNMLIIYHPAAVLRNPNREPDFREDLSKIRDLL